MALDDITTFRRRYGSILSLLKVRILYPLIEALIQHWDPKTVCFRFGMFELTPTLEEFAH
jgi:hypothetical protein